MEHHMSADGPLPTDRYTRWRLILGRAADEPLSRMAGREGLLSGHEVDVDRALEQLYSSPTDGAGSQPRGASLDASAPKLAQWLGDIRQYFNHDSVAIIQKDAIERHGLTQLLFEPETLGHVTPNIEMVGTLLSLKNMIPDRAKEAARTIVRAVVEEIKKRLHGAIEQAVRGGMNRTQHAPFPSLANLDWHRTIRRNLKNYHAERQTIVPSQIDFYARQQRRKEWHVIVCMDQSGSMTESVVYGGVTGAIFASLPALETHVVAFDTEVVDLTPHCHDPVDLLFGVQLGGGTDINRALAYCQSLITRPERTLLILISDLYEGGNKTELLRRVDTLTRSGVRMVTLLALSDSGVPSHDGELAQKFAACNVPCFGCTPQRLPALMEGALKHQDLFQLAAHLGMNNPT